MQKIVLALCLSLLSLQHLAAQQKLPAIRAKSDLVDIREGADFQKGQWTIVPEYKPDVFVTHQIGVKITFYTDLDSISWVSKVNETFDFIVLRGKDTAYTQMKYEPTYLDKLKAASAYNAKDAIQAPKFTYQSAEDPHLKALRKGLNLDSIAGKGTELSQILQLMHWIHDLIPHDGQHGNPEVKNAMSMIGVCKAEKRGLNCRGLAIVLNECYLAMGIPSRFVTCMPKDSVFDDCHVINMVWSRDLHKWIWIDPTQDAYVMDETGMLLGLEEVRERLIDGRPLILNPDANWNKISTTTKEGYLYNYMAKNLYRFRCPVSSEYDYETDEKGLTLEYIELLPLDGYNQEPKYKERTDMETGVTFKTWRTNNSAIFWAKPE